MGGDPTIRRKGKRATILMILLILLVVPLSGCWDQNEVSHVGFIISAGIDSVQNDKVDLTVQVFIPNPTSGGTSEGGGEGRVFTYTKRGDSMPEALSALQKRLPRTLSWDHTKLIIIGENLANRGMRDEIDFLFRDVEPREQANFLVCKGTAMKLLQSLDDPNTYDTIIRIADMPSVGTYNMNYVEESIAGESDAFVLPVADTIQLMMSKSPKTVLTVKGVAVIKDVKLAGWMSERDSSGLHLGFQWLHQTSIGHNLSVTVKKDGGKITAKLVRRKLQLSPSIRDGKWSMKVKLKVDADIVQNSSSIDLLSSKDSLRSLQGIFEDEIKQMLQRTLDEVQTRMGADVVGFARSFHKKHPRQWKKAERQWDTVFQTVEVTLEVKCNLRKPGISNVKI